MIPERASEAFREISQQARLAGTIAREIIRHPFSKDFIYISPDKTHILTRPFEDHLLAKGIHRLHIAALGVATAVATTAALAIWPYWEYNFSMDREFSNSQQGQVATWKEFQVRRGDFVISGRGLEMLQKAIDKSRLPYILTVTGALGASGLLLAGRRLSGLRPPDLPDPFL